MAQCDKEGIINELICHVSECDPAVISLLELFSSNYLQTSDAKEQPLRPTPSSSQPGSFKQDINANQWPKFAPVPPSSPQPCHLEKIKPKQRHGTMGVWGGLWAEAICSPCAVSGDQASSPQWVPRLGKP